MNIYDLKWSIFCRFKRSFLKIIYGNRISFGERFTFRDGLHVLIDKNGRLSIGNRCFFNNNCSLNVLAKITIENDCLFGENVKIYDHNHRFNKINKAISTQGFSLDNITIGNNCWIGSDVIILKGSHIGDNCVIAAGCIVDGRKIESGTLMRRDGSFEKIIYK